MTFQTPTPGKRGTRFTPSPAAGVTLAAVVIAALALAAARPADADPIASSYVYGITYTTVPGDRNRFGDIAIVTSGGAAGMLYAATASPSGTDAMFDSPDLNSLTTTGVATVIKAAGNPELQLSFNADESILYDQDSAGAWYELDLGTGNLGSRRTVRGDQRRP